MEINEDQPNENKQAVQGLLQEGSRPPSLASGRDSSAVRGVGKLSKGAGFMSPLIRGCWHRDAGGGLTRSGASYVICLGSIFSFPWLVVS